MTHKNIIPQMVSEFNGDFPPMGSFIRKTITFNNNKSKDVCDPAFPYHPWDWHISLLIYHKNQTFNVGKYTNRL